MPVTQLIISDCQQTNVGYLSDFNHLRVDWRIIRIARRPNSEIVAIVICVCDQCIPTGHDEHLWHGRGLDEGASAQRRYVMPRVFIDNTPISDTIKYYCHLLDIRLVQVLPNAVYLRSYTN